MTVDQVAFRRQGGFVLGSILEWKMLTRDEQAEMLKGGNVQFLADGHPVPVREALAALKA